MLPDLPESLSALVNLRKLNIASNKIAALPARLSRLAKLVDLDCHNNALGVLAADLAGLGRVTRADFRHNSLRTLPPLGGMAALRELYLGNNELVDMSKVLPPALHVLDIRDNHLAELPPVSRLGQLTSCRSP